MVKHYVYHSLIKIDLIVSDISGVSLVSNESELIEISKKTPVVLTSECEPIFDYTLGFVIKSELENFIIKSLRD